MDREEQKKGRAIWMGGTVNCYVVPAEYVIALEDQSLKIVEEGITRCPNAEELSCVQCGGCKATELRDMINESIRINTESGVRK
jgi:hypothetical protein